MLNLSGFLSYQSQVRPDKIAFVFGEQQLTYKELDEVTNQLANALVQEGVSVNDKIALSCVNSLFFPIAYYAILKVGAVVVPLSILLKSDEIENLLINSEAKVYICHEGVPQLPMLQFGKKAFDAVPTCNKLIVLSENQNKHSQVEGYDTIYELIKGKSKTFLYYPTGAEDPAAIIYTSGTTGNPKGAEISHSALTWNAMASKITFEANEKDRFFTALPLFHIFGQSCLMNCGVLSGATNFIIPRFDATKALKLLAEYKITFFAGVPTMFWELIQAARKDAPIELIESVRKNLRLCGGGAATIPVQLSKDFEELFGLKIYEGLGISEGSGITTLNPIDKEPKFGSVGKPIIGVNFKIVLQDGKDAEIGEVGELCFRGHNMMGRYYNNPEETEKIIKNGWLHTGDLAKRDEDGYYYIVDRIKEIIIRGGRNIYPKEVEEKIMFHPSVSLVAVIGEDDEKYGQEVKAYVILKSGQQISELELISWCKKNMANYKYPRFIEFVDELPMTASGKIMKKKLINRDRK